MTDRPRLVTTPNIADADDVYERLLHAHKGLDEEKSRALNARLVLILANHIGDKAILEEAIDLAMKARPTAGDR